MSIIDHLAEQHIQQAIERGELNNLQGAGRPLQLDDDSMIPPALRAAYRILKNSGFLPPELELHREIHTAEELLLQIEDPDEYCRALTRLQVLRTRLEAARGNNAGLDEGYTRQLVQKLARPDD
ncbi:MAG: DUF1992 domain-containing protein [Gammaproteobacteria bacterium]